MKLRIFTLALAVILLVSIFAGCQTAPAKEPTPEKTVEEDNTPIKVYTLNGTTGFGMAKLMSEDKTNEYTVKTDASDVTAALISGDADIAALPTNAASALYNKTEGKVVMLAVNTKGCLYLVNSTGETIENLAALKGKTVYVPAQNPTFIVTYLLRAAGLTVGTDVILDSESYAQPANLRDAVAAGTVDLAVLPEPMVTMAKAKAEKTLEVSLDLTAEWKALVGIDSLVQGCLVVRKAFLEEHPKAVEAFLKNYKASVEFLNENPKEAAALIVETGIFANATVAEKAIPKCNVCYLDGAEMKSSMVAYLEALASVNQNAIGGKLPGDDFYYLAGTND
ncbi:MAG: ABC transporter substrate-binding protein [Clostridia bacterium]|nr:ABC transporter substrate-binding protein [Clostridia bacterium]